MRKTKENDFYQWSVDKGDYQRDDHATTSALTKRRRIKVIKKVLWMILYLILVAAVSWFVFGIL